MLRAAISSGPEAYRMLGMAKSAAMRVYDLRISMVDSGPEIWRRVRVSGNIRLKKLHVIIQTVMGWTNSHLHRFVVGHVCYTDPTFEMESCGDEVIEDESRAMLRKVLPLLHGTLVYVYDFGDSWSHLVRVECISGRGKNEPLYLSARVDRERAHRRTVAESMASTSGSSRRCWIPRMNSTKRCGNGLEAISIPRPST